MLLDVGGAGLVAPSIAVDPLSFGLVYQAGSVFGTDPTEVARRAGVTKRDPLGACWLAYCDHLVGARTTWDGVEVSPPFADLVDGRWVERTPPWRDPLEGTADELAQRCYADIATTLHQAAAFDGHRTCEITGGKDSRLVLAVILSEGLEGRFHFRTSGAPDLPDVEIAGAIASRYGLSWGRRWSIPRPVLDVDALRDAGHKGSDRELWLRAHVGGWSGLVNVAAPRLALDRAPDQILVSGLFGETLCTNYPQAFHARDHDELVELLTVRLRFGAAGILRGDAVDWYRRELLAAAMDGFERHDPPQDVLDAFYIRQRLRRWLGPTLTRDDRVYPLHSPLAVRAAFSVGVEERCSSWLHRRLISRVPDLDDFPYTGGGWQDFRLPRRGLPPLPPLRPGGHQRMVSNEDRLRHEAADVELMRRYLLDPLNPVADVVDQGAAKQVLEVFGEQPEPVKRQVYGALTAAIWLGGHEITDLPRRWWPPRPGGPGAGAGRP